MSCHIFSNIISIFFCWPKLIASKMAEALCTYFIRQSGVSVAAE